MRRGNADDAIAIVRESLARMRTLDDKFAFVNALGPLAAAATLKGDDEWALRILGIRDVVTERTGAALVDASMRDLGEQKRHALKERLGADRYTRAYAAGRTASFDALMQDIEASGDDLRGPA